jgi:hypothetical protein
VRLDDERTLSGNARVLDDELDAVQQERSSSFPSSRSTRTIASPRASSAAAAAMPERASP